VLRKATINDIPEIINIMSGEHKKESVYKNFTYSPANTEICVRRWINEAEVILVCAPDIIGLSVIHTYKTYYEEWEGYFEYLYVRTEFRGSGVSRLLVEASVSLLKQNGARIIYADSGSGISEENDKLWKNLFGKSDFKHLGSIMIWQADSLNQ
jgi:GNAT superfamily N-acetyltransferase